MNRASRQKSRYADVILETKETGVHRISYADLIANGVNFKGAPNHKLALIRNGKAVPRLVQSSSPCCQKRFGPGSEIVFFASGPDEDSARYTDTGYFLLTLEGEKALPAPDLSGVSSNLSSSFSAAVVNKDNQSSLYNQSYAKTVRFGEKKVYSFGLEGDGWYDTSIRALGATASTAVPLNVSETAILDAPASLSISLLGVANFPQVDADGDGELEPNHHYRIYLNRSENPEPIIERYVVGREQSILSTPLLGQLKHGANEIEIEVIPDNGYNIDVVYFIDGELNYTAPSLMQSDVLMFESPASDRLVLVQEQEEKIIAVYSSDEDGNFARRAFYRKGDYVVTESAVNPSTESPASLSFITRNGYLSPQKIYQPSA